MYFSGSCWDLLFILVAYYEYIITLQHVKILITNLINIFMMVTHISNLVMKSFREDATFFCD
jgi:hypothetical protein